MDAALSRLYDSRFRIELFARNPGRQRVRLEAVC